MAIRSRRQSVATGILVVLLAGVLVSQALQAGASHQPANKVVADGQAVVEVPITTETTLATSTFKTSGPTDLMVHFTAECSILTELHNQGGGNVPSSTSEAEGRVRVWIELDGTEVAISQTSTTPQPHDPPTIGEDIDKVTFCNNSEKFTVTDAESNTPMDGTDTYDTYLKTKAANAFNWVVLNTGGYGTSNIHTLEVKASFDTDETVNGADDDSSGYVGNRMLIIEPTKMSNHASV